MKLRLFLALNFDRKIQNQITRQIIEPLSGKFKFLRWVKTENLHLTIRFLDSVEEAKIQEIHTLLKEPLSLFRSFRLTLRGFGGFPNLLHCQVGWLGVTKGAKECERLRTIVDDRLAPLDFSKEEKIFMPHLTVARAKRQPQDISEAKQFPGFRQEISTSMHYLSLFSSVTMPSGPIYKEILKFDFKNL